VADIASFAILSRQVPGTRLGWSEAGLVDDVAADVRIAEQTRQLRRVEPRQRRRRLPS
jgi:hypothetical protein